LKGFIFAQEEAFMAKGALSVVGLMVILASVASCSTPEKEPSPGERYACGSGLSDSVYKACKCNPRIAALDHALSATKQTENVRRSSAVCANAAASAPIHGVPLTAAIEACVKQSADLDPDIKQHLIELDSQYASAVPQAQVDNWLKCEAAHEGQ
jgi:hypothetical protein